MKKIFKGMFRPLWEDIEPRMPMVYDGEIMGHRLCSCGRILTTREAVREHWQFGHFDTPVYKDE